MAVSFAADPGYPFSNAGDCSGSFEQYSWCVEENGVAGWQNDEQHSTRGYAYRDCTDFVAWHAERSGINVHGLGNARDWDNNAPANGYRVTDTPAINMIAQTDDGNGNGYINGQTRPDGTNEQDYGRVAWVTAVNAANGTVTVTVEDYNGSGTGVDGSRTVPTARYRYIDIGLA